jgi:hypothetical protein
VLPEVVVYGYKKNTTTTTPEYYYTSFYYNNQYYNAPPNPYYSSGSSSSGSGAPPQVIVTTNSTGPLAPQPPVNDPCQANVLTTPSPANLLVPAYAGAVNALTQTFNSSLFENSMFLGIDKTTYAFTTTAITEGGINGSDGNPDHPNFVPFASAHTHPSYTFAGPSVGDIYSLARYNAQFPMYTTAYVISQSDNSITGLVVTNSTKLANFLATYPENLYHDGHGDWVQITAMARDVEDLVNSLAPGAIFGSPEHEAAWRSAQAYILDKYDTGLSMVIKNPDGKFSQIHYVKTTDAQGNVSYKKYNCN